jgi:hypothetical protein
VRGRGGGGTTTHNASVCGGDFKWYGNLLKKQALWAPGAHFCAHYLWCCGMLSDTQYCRPRGNCAGL